MTRSFILSLGTDPAGPVSWAVGSWRAARSGEAAADSSARLEASGRLASGGEIDTLDLSGIDRVVMIVPGSDVMARDVDLPARREQDARAAIPYLLEDDLASDPSTLHFALRPGDEPGRRRVAVVSRDLMGRWMNFAEQFGKTPVSIVPDFDVLQGPHEGCRIVERGERMIMLPAEGAGFTAERDLAPMLVGEAVPGDGALHLELGDADGFLAQAGLGGRAFNTRPAMTDGAFFSEVMDTLRTRRVTDLLQGAYAKAGAFAFSMETWKRAGVLAGVAVLAYAIMLGGQAWRSESMATQAQAQAEDLLRTAFPDMRRVVNPRAQLRTRLAALKAGGSDRFLKLTGVLYGAVGSVEAVELRDLRFVAERGNLSASIAYDGFRDVEQLRDAVARAGGVFTEGGSRQVNGRILGDITIGLKR